MLLSGANSLMGLDSGDYDGHAHIFSSTLQMLETRRYTPRQDALLKDYIDHLNDAGLDGALLIQPSFLGTDNKHLIDTLSEANRIPSMNFKGVAVVDSNVTGDTISQLNDAGIVGIRFNILGQQPTPLTSDWKRTLQLIAAYNWHVELHVEGSNLAPALDQLLDHCDKVVIDHYGLPNPESPLTCPGLSAICDAPKNKVYVKLSAPYRVFNNCSSKVAATKCEPIFQVLANHLDSSNLLWGSDWPWTQHEDKHTYSDTLSWMKARGQTGTDHN